MPTLPLTLPASLMAPDPAVQSADDVLAVYPREYKTQAHPVLDALNAGHAACHVAYQAASDDAAAQTDLLRSSGTGLDGLGLDHGCPRAPGESDDDYRARIFTWQGVTTPDAIVATANAIMAPYTAALPQYCESIADRWYVEDGAAVWGSFVNDSGTLNGPSYPDRLYPDDATLNGGVFRPQSDPGEPLIFADDVGRCFLLRIPELSDANGPTCYAQDEGADPLPINILTDGNMEAAGTAAWSAVFGAGLSKQSASPHSGTQWLKVTYGGSPYPAARQLPLTPGKPYLLIGYARGDDHAAPIVQFNGLIQWTGSTATAWQSNAFLFTATAPQLYFTSTASGVGQYVGFDDYALFDLSGLVSNDPGSGMFVENGMATAEMTFASADYLLSDETYQAVINAVNRIKGAGVRWVLSVDARL